MKNKSSIKGFILGVAVSVAVGAMMMSGIAASISKQITAYYNNIKIVVNGKEVVPKDANGKKVEPFIVDGTTYLPVRAVSQALGQDVSWNDSTKTVYIGQSQPSVLLKNMSTVSGKAYTYQNVKDNYGNVHKDCMDFAGTTSYSLNKQYKKFTGTIFLTQSNKNINDFYRVQVLLDGKLAYTSAIMTQNKKPINFEIDVTNASLMEVQIVYSSSETRPVSNWGVLKTAYQVIEIADAGLWKSK